MKKTELWLTCPCGEPVLHFLPTNKPKAGARIYAADFEGVKKTDPMPVCPDCGNVNLFNVVNIKEREVETDVETRQ